MEAPSRFPTPNGYSISCVCIGQPRVDDQPSPYPEDCEPNAERWILPDRPSQVRLAFHWELLEGPSVSAIEAASCVVRLNDAVQRGVPLPAGWGPKVAALLDGSAQAAGTLRGLGLLLELVALCIESMSWPAQVHLQTIWRERRQSTLNYSAVAQRLLQRLPRCDTTRVAMAASVVRFTAN